MQKGIKTTTLFILSIMLFIPFCSSVKGEIKDIVEPQSTEKDSLIKGFANCNKSNTTTSACILHSKDLTSSFEVKYNTSIDGVYLRVTYNGYNELGNAFVAATNESSGCPGSETKCIKFYKDASIRINGIKDATFKFEFIDDNDNLIESFTGAFTLSDIDLGQSVTFVNGNKNVNITKVDEEYLEYKENTVSSFANVAVNDVRMEMGKMKFSFEGSFELKYSFAQFNMYTDYKATLKRGQMGIPFNYYNIPTSLYNFSSENPLKTETEDYPKASASTGATFWFSDTMPDCYLKNESTCSKTEYVQSNISSCYMQKPAIIYDINNSDIKDNGVEDSKKTKTYCYIKELNSDRKYFDNNPTVLAGMLAWQNDDNQPLIETEYKMECVVIGKNEQVLLENIIKNVISQMKNSDWIKYLIIKDQQEFELETNVKDLSYTQLDDNSFEIEVKSSSNYNKSFKWQFLKKTGIAIRENMSIFDDFIKSDASYGIITPINLFDKELKTDIKFKLKIGDMDIITENDSASCPYTVTTKLITEGKKLNLAFRVIDTENPFPGIDAKGRMTGTNWCIDYGDSIKYDFNNDGSVDIIDASHYNKQNGYESNDVQNDSPSLELQNLLATPEGNFCSKNNPVVTKEIINSPSSNSTGTPIFSITLTPDSIKNIKGYNKGKSYDDFDLKCTDGEKCKSSFVTKILNGNYGVTVNNGSCKIGEGRSYCVGGGS